MHSAEKQKLFAAVDDFAGSENTASDRARLLAAIDEYVQAVREECAVIAWSTGMADITAIQACRWTLARLGRNVPLLFVRRPLSTT